MRRLLSILAAGALVAAVAVPVSAATAPVKASVIYSSLLGNPLPGNSPSVGAEAYAFNEFGNQVTFTGTKRTLTSVIVTMSSWGCVTGTWYAGNCMTPAGATFSEPITFNIYNEPDAGTPNLPGTLITSVTQTFAIPYRPSASTKCTGASAGKWYDTSSKTCFNGLADKITFNFSGVTLPNSVVYGIAYDTSHFGPNPIGESAPCYTSSGGCGYDSLNIALSKDPTNVTAGSNTNPGTVWQNTSYASNYCDGGAAGTGFRLDSPTTGSYDPTISGCWSVGATGSPYYVPAVQFKAGN